MPIDTLHPQAEARRPQWRRIRDCLEGEDAVKAAGPRYLPPLSGMDPEDYAAYLQRALFFEAAARTVDGLMGAVFRKDPLIEAPPAARPLIDDATLAAQPLDGFAKDVVREVLAIGRHGILVDHPEDGGRPYLRAYRAEDIVNWRMGTGAGAPRLDWLVLRETVETGDGDDPFRGGASVQWRLLALEDGRYVQRVYAKRAGGRDDDFDVIAEHFPARAGRPLDTLPFVFVGPSGLGPDIARSPILGLCNVNLSHYRTSADLEHGAHFTALPTPYVVGANGEAPELRIGSGTAWLLPAGASAGMLEFSGQGLEALERRLERKERAMAVLGARLLEDQKRGVEAAETVRMRHRGENSVLASVAGSVSRALERALKLALWWAGADAPKVSVRLNRDFTDTPLSGDELRALVEAWQLGAYPKEVLWRKLREGEVIPGEFGDDRLGALPR